MPIGSVSPGNYTTVTPDVLPAEISSIQTPSPTMPVVAIDLAALTLQTLNIKTWIRDILVGNRALSVELIGLTTFLGDVHFHGGGAVEYLGSPVSLVSSTITLDSTSEIDAQPGALVRVRNTATLQLDAGSTFYHHGTGLFRIASTTVVQIDGDWPVAGDVSVGGDLSVTGPSSFLGGVTLYGTGTNTGILSDSGIGRHRQQITVGPSVSTTFNFGGTSGATNLTNLIHFRGTLSGDIHYQLKNVGAGVPDMVDISVVDANMGGHHLFIWKDNGTQIADLTGAAGAEVVKVYHDGTDWRRFAYYG